MKTQSLVEIQEIAVNAILDERQQGIRAMAYGRSLLDKTPMVIRGIRKWYVKAAKRQGWNDVQIRLQWEDIKEIAVLTDNAEG